MRSCRTPLGNMFAYKTRDRNQNQTKQNMEIGKKYIKSVIRSRIKINTHNMDDGRN